MLKSDIKVTEDEIKRKCYPLSVKTSRKMPRKTKYYLPFLQKTPNGFYKLPNKKSKIKKPRRIRILYSKTTFLFFHFRANRPSILALSDCFTSATSSFEASNATLAWLNGLSSCFSNSFRTISILCCRRRPGRSCSTSGSLFSSNAAYAALYRLSGCRSTLVELVLVDRERASSALSIPEASKAAAFLFWGPSRSERSRVPLDFFGAALELFGLAFWDSSSAARRASRSAFFRAASAFLASACSLYTGER